MNTAQTDFKKYLQNSAKEIEKELLHIATLWKRENETELLEVNALTKRLTDSWIGGKMLRGTLVKMGFELATNKPSVSIIKPAAAFEVLHTSLLIHDDIIDKSPQRRGKPAMHVHQNDHYGISQAICLGDIGISLSGKLISESNFPEQRKNKALTYFFEVINNTLLGEMMDVASAQKMQRTEKEVLTIHMMKTANYTFVGPLTFGAILAGATEDLLSKLQRFAEPLGIAYQIRDDILGIFGNEKKIGKSTLSDIEENKSTLLITFALKHANQQQKKLLTLYYGKKGITTKEHEIVKKIFMETGALRYSQNHLTKLSQQAEAIISSLTGEEQLKELLKQLANSISIPYSQIPIP